MKLIQVSILIVSLIFISQSTFSQETTNDKTIKVANGQKKSTHLETKTEPKEVYLHLETGVKQNAIEASPKKFSTENLSIDEVKMYLHAFNAKLDRLNEVSADSKSQELTEKRKTYLTELKSNIKQLEIKQKELQSK